MIINYNGMAANSLRMLNINQGNQAKTTQQLSSGLRINGAADDAAGLAISEKMRGQIRGLDQATRNSQDGISMIQTAEGALNETHDILQRMRELAVQSSNDTNTDQDRKNIQSEVGQLEKEIDRIGNTTQFNTKNLLDGSMSKQNAAAVANQNINKSVNSATTAATKLFNLTDNNGNSLGIKSTDTITINYTVNGALNTQTLTGSADITALAAKIGGATLSASASGLKLTAAAAGTANAIEGITISVADAQGNVNSVAGSKLSAFNETTEARDVQAKDGSATLLIGANGGQNLKIDINDMRSQALGVNNLDVSTQAGANTAIKVIDNATQKVSAERAKLGAFENRLQHTINNLGTSSENLTTAESRIRDVDMAKAVMENTKNSILAQAAQGMLAQANQQPQQVLQLLR
ncbi:flagellin [Aneurinibacillus sp. Ricciae_BoGa-3]|uniref:flagellin N-terminal helical domain-containing protein n=1 Tax=Aneurinibacillus sp. Ricciae_BoGa-3 TaxID=3022697 RepID=UPI002340C0CA|nr:flagellin [Aneurinibacillus sp. Ricciae_BoGa-3]WCK54195.1 flagellin [Aneurinibacillus sp. Ricciae_BoGa-3]